MALHLTRIDELALVTLDRPEVLNALNFELLHDVGAALDQVAGGDARALLVTGAGDRAFCAGADIKELMDRSLRAQREGAAFGQAIFRQARHAADPVDCTDQRICVRRRARIGARLHISADRA